MSRHSKRTTWLVPSLLLLSVSPAFAAPAGGNPGGGNTCTAEAKTGGNGTQNAVENAQVQLNAEPSSPNGGEPIAYLWQQVGGPSVTLSNATVSKPTFTAPPVGPSGAVLTFRLTVTGCTDNQTSSILHTVNIIDSNVGPVNTAPLPSATSSPNPAFEGTIVTLSAAGSTDPENDPLTFSWAQTGGTAVTLSDATAASPTFTAPNTAYPNGDTLEFTVTVSDGVLTANKAVLSNIVWSDDPPVALLACPETVAEGGTIHFDASGSTDSDDGIASYAWHQSVSPPIVPVDGETAPVLDILAPSLGYQEDGFVTVEMTVTDHAGQSSMDDCIVQILDVTPPVLTVPADFSVEATSPSGAVVTYSASATDAVDGAVTAVCVPTSGSQFALGHNQVDCAAEDSANNEATASFDIEVVDTTAPVISQPDDIFVEATSASGAVVSFNLPTATDIVDIDVEVTCDPVSGIQYPLGVTTVTCVAKDDSGNTASVSFGIHVSFKWTGFFKPIDNLPILNAVKAGSSVPVKFSLGGNMGLGIFAPGYPTSGVAACDATLEDAIEETVNAGGSSLVYDATAGQYVYVWKTEKAWAGTCRTLVVKLADGSFHYANFKLTR
jgi:hypothetical protein